MTYRIWAPAALDKKADFTLELAIPESAYPENNPDGTRPVASLKVEATTIKFALQTLQLIAENQTYADLVAFTILKTDNYNDVAAHDPENFRTLMRENHNPFMEFSMDATGEEEDAGKKVTLTLTAPSGIIAVNVFKALTKSDKLNALAASFMPEDRDEEYDDYDDEDDDEV